MSKNASIDFAAFARSADKNPAVLDTQMVGRMQVEEQQRGIHLNEIDDEPIRVQEQIQLHRDEDPGNDASSEKSEMIGSDGEYDHQFDNSLKPNTDNFSWWNDKVGPLRPIGDPNCRITQASR